MLVAAGAVPSMCASGDPTFDDLRAEAHRGEIVYVTDQGGTKVRGRVVRISATSIDLLVNGGSREVARLGRGADHAAPWPRRSWVRRWDSLSEWALAALLVITDGECANYGSLNCGA